MQRQLILMRHAKSAWPMGVSDVERPLSKRGVRTAPISGRWISDNCQPPGLVFVSPAKRTRQTWELVSLQLATEAVDVESKQAMYGASWWELLDAVRSAPAPVTSLMLVGHNPGFEDLASELAGSGDPSELRALRTKFPTCAVAVLVSDEAWSDWGSGCAELRAFHTPRHDISD